MGVGYEVLEKHPSKEDKTAVTKYHFSEGASFTKVSTFMPKKPTRKVRGKNTKVIQLSRHKLALSSTERRAPQMLTDLYIRSIMWCIVTSKPSSMQFASTFSSTF
jgi:hypothetical protein